MLLAPTLRCVGRATARVRLATVAKRWISTADHRPGFQSTQRPGGAPSNSDFNLTNELIRLTEELVAIEEERKHSSATNPSSSSSSSAEPLFRGKLQEAESEALTPREVLRRHSHALPPSRSLFLTNIASGATEDDVIKLMEEVGIHGVLHAHVRRGDNFHRMLDQDNGGDHAYRGQGYGWAMFKTVEDAIHAHKTIKRYGLHFQLNGDVIKAQYAESENGPMDEPPESKRLFVGRFCGTPDDFYRIFDKYKEQINYLDLKPYKKTDEKVKTLAPNFAGQYYGFIAFSSVENAKKCLEALDEQEVIPGVWLHLAFADRIRKRVRKSIPPSGWRTWQQRHERGAERYASARRFPADEMKSFLMDTMGQSTEPKQSDAHGQRSQLLSP